MVLFVLGSLSIALGQAASQTPSKAHQTSILLHFMSGALVDAGNPRSCKGKSTGTENCLSYVFIALTRLPMSIYTSLFASPSHFWPHVAILNSCMICVAYANAYMC